MTNRIRPVRAVVATAAAAVFGLPLYLCLVNVFKRNEQITAAPAALPAPITLGNLGRVLTRPDHLFWDSLLHSVLIVVPVLVCTIVLGSMLGYYLGREQGTAVRLLQGLLLIGLMLPFQVLLLPLSVLLRSVELQGSYLGLVLFNIGYYVPFAGFVYGRFMKTVPRELDEAAEVDGAGRLRTFAQIIVPLLRPVTASAAIFIGVWVWNDFLNPLVILGPAGGTTVTTGIYNAIGQYNTDFGSMFALMLLAALPVLAFFLALQDRFVSGLTAGATKG
ncbi:carbohydrate ABC transporter permease [Micromonospora mirobrigensis]|uniref:Raffinose/stachyose/melibiose transport system permease protein n=1 Tax=Micromonospora mirobrigensis TaxID=262898 RepID=A0A1C4YYW2_9ACTN|nr:carbohydrate ABC transporter permease [Micromonospora mirobrigensis]SCF25923.1 raffinose/stachyose/melibiose transport system permease protein [Micromonospora mirobrigensis]